MMQESKSGVIRIPVALEINFQELVFNIYWSTSHLNSDIVLFQVIDTMNIFTLTEWLYRIKSVIYLVDII